MASDFSGTMALVKAGLRRDRIILPVAILGLVGWAVLYPIQYDTYFPTQASIESYAQTIESNPAFEAFFGPGSALDTFDGLVSWEMGPVLSIVAALFAMFMLVRHTRSEEEDGRTELLLAQTVGRLAHLGSALVITVGGLLVLSVLWWVGLVLAGLDPGGTAVQVAAILSCGLVFAGVTAVAAQAISHARSVRGMVGALLGALYVLRGIGDLTDSPISWLSPIQWVIATDPYATPNPWPLFLAFLVAVLLCLFAFRMASSRDLGAGLLRPRPGPPGYSSHLPPSLAMAWRIQRGTVLGWAIGLSIAALLYGAIAVDIEDLLGQNPQFSKALLQAGGGLLDSYFATMLDFYAIVATGFVIASTLRPASEEKSGRAELPLASAPSRVRWAAGNLVVALFGAVLLMVLTGALSGVGYGLAGGNWSMVGELAAAGPTFVPAMLVLGGLAALSFGISPRAGFVAWAFYALCALLLTLESLTVVVGRLADVSPFTHLALVPAEAIAVQPLLVLSGIAVLLSAAGLSLWGRRDLT
ncbi:MAG: ABC transporter permease [Solirubrobacterales bacterium]